MNKGIIVRASLVFATLVIIILIAVACDTFDGSATEARISNPDSVFMTVDGMDITNEEIWDVMKNVDGLDYVQEYVQAYLLADYITAVTQEEIDAELRLLTYLTEDEDVIAEIMADPEIHQDYLDAFRQNVEVLGYDSEDAASLRSFVELSLAKRAYTKEQIVTAGEDDLLFVDEETIISYYDETRLGNVCTLDIRFQNTLEVDAVFSHFNYVPNYLNGIGEYIGTEDIDTLAKGEFTAENTVEMTDAGVWSAYVQMYNYMNPWLTPLDENITQEEYCAQQADSAVKSYEDLVKYKSESDPNVGFASYIFNDLDLDTENLIPYTYTTNKVFGDYIMLVYKVSQDEVDAYVDLEDSAKQVVLDELYNTLVSDAIISSTISILLEESGFELLDPDFQLKYEFQTGVTFDNKGSETNVAKTDDMNVSADQLFEYMTERIGTFYSLEVAKMKVLLSSDAYTEIYGDSYDYLNSKNDKMVEHRDSLREMKSIFSSNGYSTYGYSSSAMTWDEFIYLAFGVDGEADLIETMFVISELQYDFIFDTIKYEPAVAYMQDKVDNYFSLNVDHLLVFIDFDGDFAPDDFSDYVDGLDVAEKDAYDALKVDFENLLAAKFNDDYTLQMIVDEYTESLIGDTESEWYEFKNAGFFIMTENLGEIDHFTVGNLDDSFGDALKRIYEAYSSPASSEASTYKDDQIVVTDFGLHLIEVRQGTNFEMATAVFEFTDENSGSYSDGSEGTTIIPNKAQVDVYLAIQKDVSLDQNPSEILPANVTKAIEYYYGPVYDSYMSQTGFSVAIGNYILENGVSYTNNNDESIANLENLVAVFAEVNFPELFDADAE